MSNLTLRLITAIIGIILITLLHFFWENGILFFSIGLSFLLFTEGLFLVAPSKGLRILGWLSLILLWWNEKTIALVFILFIIAAPFMNASLRGLWGVWWFLFYAFVPWFSYYQLSTLWGNKVFMLLVLHWVADTAAYFVGKFFGRHSLAPTISPKKTWEGAIAGIGLTLAIAIIAYAYFAIPILIAGAIIAIFSILGDLTESWIKRQLQIKDSSQWLPGHGGFLDRFDSFTITLPLLALLTQVLSLP